LLPHHSYSRRTRWRGQKGIREKTCFL